MPRPPRIPGYVLHTWLGRGTYGEVWLGENRTTKRQVAVKFLRSRAALDWTLLDGETDRLAFLAADRRVVQLLDVGRDADPPFFVMEYVSGGSLAQHLTSAGLPPLGRAVATFEEITLGLMQVHAKGILHCDLKPSNILLDDELRPRLADFGQSRLGDDRSPVLAPGTFFFMAPEQADPAAIPDARWDVYALGAVLFTMLSGRPPHESEEALAAIRAQPDLTSRLARYRQIVAGAPSDTLLLRERRIDRPLREILARCLTPDPGRRFSSVAEVALALQRRREARARRPMLLLGGLGPLLLMAVVAVFGVRAYREATSQSADAIRHRAFESNRYAAAFIARSFEGEIRRDFEIVSDEAARPELGSLLRRVSAAPEVAALAATEPGHDDAPAPLRTRFFDDPVRQGLDRYFRGRLDQRREQAERDLRAPRFVSMFAISANGIHLGAAYADPGTKSQSVGKYYAWRSYFHGGPQDLPRATPRDRLTPVSGLHLSAPYRSTTTRGWRVGVSQPVYDLRNGERVLVGVLVLSVDIGNFDVLAAQGQPARDRFAVLVDARGDDGSGRILLHPYFADRPAEDGRDPDRDARRPLVHRELLARIARDWRVDYQDPLGQLPEGAAYRGSWIAAAQPLRLADGAADGAKTGAGLVLLVQERADAATGPVERLGHRLVRDGLWALASIAATVGLLWLLALRGRAPRAERAAGHAAAPSQAPRPLRDRSTLSERSL